MKILYARSTIFFFQELREILRDVKYRNSLSLLVDIYFLEDRSIASVHRLRDTFLREFVDRSMRFLLLVSCCTYRGG